MDWAGVLRRPLPVSAASAFRATLMPRLEVRDFRSTRGRALSPNGKTLAFVASTADGRKQIWLRSLTEWRPAP
jgi:hypothetical protein